MGKLRGIALARDKGLEEGGSSSKREEKAEGNQYLDKPCKVKVGGYYRDWPCKSFLKP